MNKITDFQPQKKNANKHTSYGLRLLEKSVQQDGFIDAQTAAADGEIISGSARLELAAEKFADVEPIIVDSDGTRPVIIRRTDIPNAETARARRLSVAANKIAQVDFDPDFAILKEWAGEDEQIKKLFSDDEWREGTGEEAPQVDAEPQIDRAAELQEKWKTCTGQLWKLGEHRLLIGDCTDDENYKRLVNGEIPDFAFTDPPYNVGVKYTEATNDNQTKNGFIEWCKGWTKNLPERHVLTVGIKRLVWWDDILGDPQWIIAWVKRNGQGQTGLGGTNKWDAIICYGVGQDHKTDMIELNNDYSEGVKANGGHPTAKPVELWKQVIQRFGAKIVYEPFGGSGTTILACQSLGVTCYSIEISPAYGGVILERFFTATGITPELVE